MDDLIIIGIAAMLFLAFGIIFFVILYQRRVIRHQQQLNELNKQKELELVQASIRGEEEERKRLASELHDDVGATLASVKLFLHSQNDELGNRPVFVQSRDLIDETIKKVRNLSHNLQPTTLKQLGLGAAFKSFFESFNKSGAFHIEFTDTDIPRFEENIELSLYRIVQELTNNTLKHTKATKGKFTCQLNGDTLISKFMHNGSGLSDETFNEYVYKTGAIGLKNIVTRLKTINGNIKFYQELDMSVTQISIPHEQD